MGVTVAVGGLSSKIRPASEGEDTPVQMSLAQSGKQKGTTFGTGVFDHSLLVTLQNGHD